MDFFNCKVDHGVDRGKFKTAVKMWATGADGCNGTTGKLLKLLQWTKELESVVPWSDVVVEFDAAIGPRRHFDMESILNGDADELDALDNYADEVYGRVAALYESKVASVMTRKPVVKDDLFVIRWAEHVRGQFVLGNFEFCHHDEKEAKNAMYADFNQKLAECKSDYIGFKVRTEQAHDYCGIVVDNDDHPTFEWWIDKIGVVD